MFTCPKCHTVRHVHDFYPNRTETSWCKFCIDKRRGFRARHFKAQAKLAQLDQANILAVIQQVQVNGEPLIYLLQADNRYKIGFTTNLARRIKTFNTASPKPHKIIAVAPGGKLQEQQLHQKLQNLRVFGEWFELKPQIFETFRQLDGVMIFLPGFITEQAPSSPSVMGSPSA